MRVKLLSEGRSIIIKFFLSESEHIFENQYSNQINLSEAANWSINQACLPFNLDIYPIPYADVI